MKKFLNSDSKTLNYILFLPEKPLADLPLLIYLHGAGERGENLEHLYRHAIPKFINEGREYDALVLCPQCPANAVWDNVVYKLKELIDSVVQEYGVKKDRICITGSSMGGFGTWMMGLTFRNFFSAIGPVAGGGMSWRCSNLCKTPVFAMHGDKDAVVPIGYSQLMVDSLKKAGGEVEFKVLEGYGHNDGIEKAYADNQLTDWLLSKRRSDFSYVPEYLEELF